MLRIKYKNVPIFMDTKMLLGIWSKEVDFVKINNKEFLINVQNGTTKYCKNLITTNGSDGACWYRNKKLIRCFGVDPVKISCVSGTGDTFLAALAIRYIEIKDIERAIIFANKAARIAVSKPGVVAVKREEII